MIIKINTTLREYLIQAINSFAHRYGWLPKPLKKLLDKLEILRG